MQDAQRTTLVLETARSQVLSLFECNSSMSPCEQCAGDLSGLG